MINSVHVNNFVVNHAQVDLCIHGNVHHNNTGLLEYLCFTDLSLSKSMRSSNVR